MVKESKRKEKNEIKGGRAVWEIAKS